MKKIILLACSFVLVLQIQAQTKITKTNVVGKWSVSAVEMTGMFAYYIDKDSLALGEMMKAQVKDDQQLAGITAMMKPQLSVFSKMAFVFKEDGTAELGSGTDQAEAATYTVDEANSTIITTDKEKKEQVLKAEIKDEKLRITLQQPQGEIQMVLKKVK